MITTDPSDGRSSHLNLKSNPLYLKILKKGISGKKKKGKNMVAKKCQTSSAAKIIFRVTKYSENKLLFKVLCFFKKHNLEYVNILSLCYKA